MISTIAFGPVPSRRLGRSLGVNNIPAKICSYNCVYCQVGRTKTCTVRRSEFYPIDLIVKEVGERVKGRDVDYITFVPDGEPTLDSKLGEEIDALKDFGRVAVITNSSILFRSDVISDLLRADLVSLKVDAVDERTWRSINRPCRDLDIKAVLDGMREFSKLYEGVLITETMLVDGLNTDEMILREIADFLVDLSLSRAYVSLPIRPPAENWVKPPDRVNVDLAYMVFKSKGLNVYLLNERESGDFELGLDVKEGVISILRVHPMRKSDLERTLKRLGLDWSIVESLEASGEIEHVEYDGEEFFRAVR